MFVIVFVVPLYKNKTYMQEVLFPTIREVQWTWNKSRGGSLRSSLGHASLVYGWRLHCPNKWRANDTQGGKVLELNRGFVFGNNICHRVVRKPAPFQNFQVRRKLLPLIFFFLRNLISSQLCIRSFFFVKIRRIFLKNSWKEDFSLRALL